MADGLDGKRIIVTGAATGIGRATAERLLSEGAKVALWDIDGAMIAEHANAAREDGKSCIPIKVDVASAAAVASAFEATVDRLGGLDGAFNNAGVGAPSVPVEFIEETDFDRVLSINLKGVWLCMRQQMRYLSDAGGGSIVNNASVAGLVALAMQGGYTAAKHGVVGLTKAAAVEGAANNIRVNAVCPGAVRTPILKHLEEAGIDEDVLAAQAPQARIADPAEIASAVCWLLSPAASFVTGAAMPVDGGWTAR